MSERNETLRLNEYLRNNDGVRKTNGHRWALSIPMDDFARLCRVNPALSSKDSQEYQKAWLDFMKDDASIPYRVMEKI